MPGHEAGNMVKCYICGRTPEEYESFVVENYKGPGQAAVEEATEVLRTRREKMVQACSGYEEPIANFHKNRGNWRSNNHGQVPDINNLTWKIRRAWGDEYDVINSVVRYNGNTVDLKPYLREYSKALKLGPYDLLNEVSKMLLLAGPSFYDFVIEHMRGQIGQTAVQFTIDKFKSHRLVFGIDRNRAESFALGLGGTFHLTVDLCPVCSHFLGAASSASYEVREQLDDY